MLFTVKDAAKFLNVSPRTIDRAKNDGRLNYRQIGACIRFTQDDLDAFITKASKHPVSVEKPQPEKNGLWEVKKSESTCSA
jgi:excisionase family DNA binding protein